MNEDRKWPDKILDGQARNYHLDSIYHKRQASLEADYTTDHYPGQQWLMGYAIPPFQRPIVWERERMIRFVESAILGLHLGTFVFNTAPNYEMTKLEDGREVYIKTDQWLIDGQQRLNALDQFFSDAFPVFDVYWSNVGKNERRRILSRTPFGAFETQIKDEQALRELYDRLNFGGVAHTEEQRALPDNEGSAPRI